MTSGINQNRLYNILCHQLLKNINFDDNKLINLIVDKRQHGDGISKFDEYLRNNLELFIPLKATLDITHEESHNHKGIQAVDLFCHGIFRKYEYSDESWYKMFQNRISLEKKYSLHI